MVTRCFRAVFHAFQDDPLPSRAASGRFHDSSSAGPTSYLAEKWTTAWKEVTYRWKADHARYRKFTVTLVLKKVVDLTDETMRKKYGISLEDLIADSHAACQRLSHRLRSEGVEAVRTFSKADPKGFCWVVFLECLAKGSSLKIETEEPVLEGGM